MVGQASRNSGESVVIEVQLSQVGDVSKSAIFHRDDLIVAQTQPAEKIRKMRHGKVLCVKDQGTKGRVEKPGT